MKTKVLFMINDLGQGGAEKVLANLVNNMDRDKFDITVQVLFAGGVNEKILKPHIKLKSIWKKPFPGNSKILQLLTPKQAHALFIKEKYDIEIAYLEGTVARIISGCRNENTALFSWIHVQQHSREHACACFRSSKEAEMCYNRFDKIVCVSQSVKEDFEGLISLKKPATVLYNTVESETIRSLSLEPTKETFSMDTFHLSAVGTFKESKGFGRLLRIVKRLKQEGYALDLFLLGKGNLQSEFEQFISENGLEDTVFLPGYQTNPYKYIAKSDLFVCSSFAEGFSTAATEALILGVPVCTVEVSGMREMLGDNNEYGIITENDEEALYLGIKGLLDNQEQYEHYKNQAQLRGLSFSTERTVQAVQKEFHQLMIEEK